MKSELVECLRANGRTSNDTYNRYKQALKIIATSTAEEATRTVAEEALRFRHSHGLPQRNATIWAERQNGMTYKKIGEKFGISASRVRDIVDKEERIRRRLLDAKREAV